MSLWQKTKEEEFDVAIGTYDGAEVSEAVGLFLLDKLSSFIDMEYVGIYRDDGVTAISGGGPEVERMKKKIISVFKEEKLNITTEGGTKVVDFLDIFMNLSDGSYCPICEAKHKHNVCLHHVQPPKECSEHHTQWGEQEAVQQQLW